MQLLRFLAVALALGCLAPSPARATTMLDQSVAQLTASAERVVIGQVKSVRSWLDRSAPASGAGAGAGVRVMTEATVAISETLKGPPSEPIVTLRQLGGTAGEGTERRTQHIAGYPRWREGEVVLLFLQPTDTGRLTTAGLSLGKYTLEPGTGGRVMARRESGELNRLNLRRTPDRTFLGASPSEDLLPLDDLRRRIAGEPVRAFPTVLRPQTPQTAAPLPRVPQSPTSPGEVVR